MHLLLTHLPIVGSLLGVLALIAGFAFRSEPVKRAALGILLLAALGGCTGMDVASILAKMRQSWTKLEVRVDAELTDGAWIVVPAERPDVFTARPDLLWRAVLRRQGGRLAWLADAPDDLSSN